MSSSNFLKLPEGVGIFRRKVKSVFIPKAIPRQTPIGVHNIQPNKLSSQYPTRVATAICTSEVPTAMVSGPRILGGPEPGIGSLVVVIS